MSVGKESSDKINPANPNGCSIAFGASQQYGEDVVTQEFYGSAVTESYRLKSELIGRAMQDIGMGPFQWKLFLVCGLGGMIDNLYVPASDNLVNRQLTSN